MKTSLKRNLFTLLLLVVSTMAYAGGVGPDFLRQAIEMGIVGAEKKAPAEYTVRGDAFNAFGYGEWKHTYNVTASSRNRQASGTVTMELTHYATPETPEEYWEYTNAIECFEYDETTNEAWLGGRLTHSNVPDIFPIGSYIIEYAKDGGPDGDNDLHGSWYPSWHGQGENCRNRPGPLYADPVEIGNITILRAE